MRRSFRTLLIATAIAITGMELSGAPASAAPDNPCDLAVSFFCRFVPMAPELDGDVDLSNQVPSAPTEESLPPVDICARGCV